MKATTAPTRRSHHHHHPPAPPPPSSFSSTWRHDRFPCRICPQVASWRFPCHAGSAWLLSSHARNKASHGVLADSPNRESLNLRFGLHTADDAGEFSAYEEVDRHWEWGAQKGRQKSGYHT
mmetsp:Transcript_3528/g.5809  ORF Transcript_3528/g.5809 Transcript_3528/m.5809 type:complete len:121 (+) Transcript_3528:213-575(+)